MAGIDGISGIGIGASSMSGVGGGYSNAKDTKSGIRMKITKLNEQLSEAEKAQSFQGVNLSSEISSLEKRIDNLKKRLDKFDESDKGECQTCKNRKYQDGSDDPGVSFKTPTKISPENASSAVRGHEMEHVTRNKAKADREGKEVVSQSVTIHTGVCPECGKSYVSGGVTKTVTRSKQEDKYKVGMEDTENGKIFDSVA